MNKLIVAVFLIMTAVTGWAQEPVQSRQQSETPNEDQSQTKEVGQEHNEGVRHIPAKEAKMHMNETLAVCGNVVSGVYNRRSQQKITYLNFDKPYPDNTFTAVIFRKNRRNFDYKPEKLEGQWICAYGLITSYRGNPQINVVIPQQIVAKEYPK